MPAEPPTKTTLPALPLCSSGALRKREINPKALSVYVWLGEEVISTLWS
jgi:hypothetical protein